jgi:hypothetical protein
MADDMQKTRGTVPQFTSTNRSVMQKKFKINDGSNTFVEANTLLDPANNSATNQNTTDEINEVSTQLSTIKKKHDESKKAVTGRQ